MKKKGVLNVLLIVVLVIVMLPMLSRWVNKDEETGDATVEGVVLNEALENATGASTLNIRGKNELLISEASETALGSEYVQEITIDGGEDGATVRAMGNGNGTVVCAEGGLLRFKNLKISDETPDGSRWNNYLYFGGKLEFVNCTFMDAIYLKKDAEASFVNCKFKSMRSSYYSVWCADGSMRFENCAFTGYRGLKIHEEKNSTDQIESVSVNGCKFSNLSEKPGVVIGNFYADPTNTTVSVKNSVFTRCAPWDRIGSIEGIDGLYETDIYSSEFNLVTENNAVDYTDRYTITYIAVQDGELTKINSELWKEEGYYPTVYVFGEEHQIDDLKAMIYLTTSTDLGFYGWYLDEECTEAFDGVITPETFGNITLYAKLEVAEWTPFY